MQSFPFALACEKFVQSVHSYDAFSVFKKSLAGVSAAEVLLVGAAAGEAADGSRKGGLKNTETDWGRRP